MYDDDRDYDLLLLEREVAAECDLERWLHEHDGEEFEYDIDEADDCLAEWDAEYETSLHSEERAEHDDACDYQQYCERIVAKHEAIRATLPF